MTTTAAFQLSRVASLDPNATTLGQKASGAMAQMQDGTTFVTVRDHDGLRHLVLVPDDGSAERDAFAFAQSVSAKESPVELPELSAPALARLEFDRHSVVGSATQAGAELRVVSDAIAAALEVGDWVAVTVRRPYSGLIGNEPRRYRHWVEQRMGATHHSLRANAVMATFWAGASTPKRAKSILSRVVNTLPGWDWRTKPQVLRSRALPLLLSGGAASAVAAVASAPLHLATPVTYVAGAGAIALLLGAALVGTGRIATARGRVLRGIASGVFPKVERRILAPARPRKPKEIRNQDGTVTMMPGADGDYPFAMSAFLVGPELPLAISAPHAGAQSGASSVRGREPSPELYEQAGALLGTSGGRPVYLSDEDQWSGLFVVGEAGSGKSAFLAGQWGYDTLARRYGRGPSGGHAMWLLDVQGTGQMADLCSRFSNAAGDKVLNIDLMDAASEYGIELLPTAGTVVQRAAQIADVIKDVMGEVSIGRQSMDSLRTVFAGALAVDQRIAASVGLPTDRSAMFYANVLIGNGQPGADQALAEAIISAAAAEAPGTDLDLAAEALFYAFRTITSAQRMKLFDAPRTKVASLAMLEQWWSRPKRVSVERLLREHHAVTLNLGSSPDGVMLDKSQRSDIGAFILATLRNEIERVCAGWEESGQVVSIYCDEVKSVAAASPSVITWLRSDGRKFGVRAKFATQEPENLPQSVQQAVLGFGTIVAYSQGNPDVIRQIIARVSVDGSSWEVQDVSGLARFQAIVNTKRAGQRMPTFTVDIPIELVWAAVADDPSGWSRYAAAQGFFGTAA